MKDLLERHRTKDGETPKQGGPGGEVVRPYDQGLLQIRNMEFSDSADM